MAQAVAQIRTVQLPRGSCLAAVLTGQDTPAAAVNNGCRSCKHRTRCFTCHSPHRSSLHDIHIWLPTIFTPNLLALILQAGRMHAPALQSQPHIYAAYQSSADLELQRLPSLLPAGVKHAAVIQRARVVHSHKVTSLAARGSSSGSSGNGSSGSSGSSSRSSKALAGGLASRVAAFC